MNTDNEIQALANDASNCIEAQDDRPVLHRTVDGHDLTPDNLNTPVYHAESDTERIWLSQDRCFDDNREEGNPLDGTSDVICERLFGEWYGIQEAVA